MLEIILVLVLVFIYITPIKGFVNLNENLLEIKSRLISFPSDLEEDELVDSEGESNYIESDFSTFVDLSSGKQSKNSDYKENNLSEASYKDYDDIDI